MFYQETDARAEKDVVAELERYWGVVVHGFGALNPIDFWVEKEKKCVGVIELKCRSHGVDTYPTVYLSMRKWVALIMTATAMGVVPIFVVSFNGEIRWVDVRTIQAKNHVIGGRSDRGADNDIEPVILVPVNKMNPLRGEL